MGINKEGLDRPYFYNLEPDQYSADSFFGSRQIPGEDGYRLEPRLPRGTKALAIASLGISIFMGESFATQYESSQTHNYTIPIANADKKADNDSMMIVAGGFAQRNAYAFGRVLEGFSSEGSVRAVVYNNGSIDESDYSQLVQNEVKKFDTKKISLWGDSMGGILQLQAAVDIRNSKDPTYVDYVVLEDTPASLDAVRKESRDDGQLLLSYTQSDLLANSRIARVGLEMALRSDEFADSGYSIPWFVTTASEVWNTIHMPNAPSSTLMGSQFSTIVTSDVRHNLIELGKENKDGKPKPTIVLIRPVSSTSDQTVDSDRNEEEYRKYALEAGLRLIVIKIPNIVHGDPTYTPKRYADIIPFILEQIDKTEQRPLGADPSIPSERIVIDLGGWGKY